MSVPVFEALELVRHLRPEDLAFYPLMGANDHSQH